MAEEENIKTIMITNIFQFMGGTNMEMNLRSGISIFFTLFLALQYEVMAQKAVTVEDMRRRYYDYMKGQHVSAADDWDTISFCSYGEREKGQYLDVRARGFYVNNLRTEKYKGHRHFWSLIRYFKEPYRDELRKHPRRQPVWGSYVKFITLDSIADVRKEEWQNALSGLLVEKNGFDYAKGLTRDIFMMDEYVCYLGYCSSAYFGSLKVRRGRVKHFEKSFDAYRHQMSILWEDSDHRLDGTFRQRIRDAMYELSRRINASMKDYPIYCSKQQQFDLLIIHNRQGSADVEVLEKASGSDELFNDLLCALRNLPPGYFPYFWTVEGIRLPCLYIEAVFEKGKWHFSMDKFISYESPAWRY